MKIRHLLAVSAVSAFLADASAFEWAPAIQQPNPSFEVTQVYQLEAMRFITDVAGVVNTDVMPKWIDEDGNEITAVNCIYDPDWAPGDFTYSFNFSDFKGNGEYTLCFPKGMLVNAAGEASDEVNTAYTVEVPELAGAMFDDFEVISVSPDFSVAQAIWDNQVVTINTNHNEAIAFSALQIFDDSTGEGIVFSNNLTTERVLGDPSPISWEVVGNYKFLEGHQYTAEFVLYNGLNDYTDDGMTPVVARQKYTFTGRVEGYKYSALTLLSITPEPNTLTISEPSQAVFTYEFSGPVNVYKAESPQGMFGVTSFPESCLSSNEDKTVWTLDLSDNEYVKTVDAELAISIYARDLEGFQLKGDFGEEEESCFTAAWQCDLGGFPIVVVSPVNGSSVEGVSEIVVKSESGSPMSWAWQGEVHVRNQFDEELGTLLYEAPEGDADSALEEFRFSKMIDAVSWSSVSLDELTDGFYSLYFDPGCFNMGDQFESKKSRSLTSTFFISGGSEVDPQEALRFVTSDPEVGSTVESLNKILLYYGEPVACDDFEVEVYSAVDGLVSTGVARMDYSEDTMVVITLFEPIETDGKYEVVIPARQIINGDWYFSDGAEGLCNPEYHLNFTVEAASGPVIDPAEQEVFIFDRVSPESGSTVTSLSKINLWYPDIVDTMGKDALVYKLEEGAEPALVNFGVVVYDWDDLYMINVELDEPIDEAGVYEVVIPARAICTGEFFESDGKKGICNPEIRLTYTVDPDGSAVVSVAADKAANVYDLNGRIVIRNATASDIKKLDKGIYIVGGRKLVVR